VTSRSSYDLTTQPCVKVATPSGDVEVSLTEALVRSHELAGLAGESPTQDFALLRLLLAMLYAACDGPTDRAEHEAMWRAGRFDEAVITEYLDEERGHLDLLDADRPFMQVPDLALTLSNVGKYKDPGSLVPGASAAEVPGVVGEGWKRKPALYSSRSGAAMDRMTFAEAFRWLVHAHQYDVAGIHGDVSTQSGARIGGGQGDGKRFAPKGVIAMGWLGQIGGLYAQGASLFETLMLNLIPYDQMPGWDLDEDLPSWELAQRDLLAIPVGPRSLYSHQARRIRLFHDEQRVVGVLITYGDQFDFRQVGERVEPMTSWWSQSTKGKSIGYRMPKTFSSAESMWRGLPTILAQAVDGEHPRSAPVVDWVGRLAHLRPTVGLRAAAMVYDDSGAGSVKDTFVDELSLPTAVMDPDQAILRAMVVDSAAATDSAAFRLKFLTGDLLEAAGMQRDNKDGKGRGEAASARAFAALDRPFRSWIGSLDGTGIEAARSAWATKAQTVLNDLARRLADEAGPVALIGRDISSVNKKGDKSTRRMCSAIALSRARAGIRKALHLDIDHLTNGEPS
jgi:CRISPR system Cascade subunit CasA